MEKRNLSVTHVGKKKEKTISTIYIFVVTK